MNSSSEFPIEGCSRKSIVGAALDPECAGCGVVRRLREFRKIGRWTAVHGPYLPFVGIGQAAFDDLMYRIAADPEMRKAYNEAMNR